MKCGTILPLKLLKFEFCCAANMLNRSRCVADDCSDETRCECRLLTRAEVLRLDKSLQPSFAKGYM